MTTRFETGSADSHHRNQETPKTALAKRRTIFQKISNWKNYGWWGERPREPLPMKGHLFL